MEATSIVDNGAQSKSYSGSSCKKLLKLNLIKLLGKTTKVSDKLRRLWAFAQLQSSISGHLDPSVITLGRPDVHGTGNIHIGRNVTLYREVHLESWGKGSVNIGDHVLLSRGVHIVSMSLITIGDGTLIGEYTSIRDANHTRFPGQLLRDSGHTSKPVTIGRDVWIGRGVTILPGVHIGDQATVGANAVVTKDVPSGTTVVGVPAKQV